MPSHRFQAREAESAVSGIVRKIIYVVLAIAVLPVIWSQIALIVGTQAQ